MTGSSWVADTPALVDREVCSFLSVAPHLMRGLASLLSVRRWEKPQKVSRAVSSTGRRAVAGAVGAGDLRWSPNVRNVVVSRTAACIAKWQQTVGRSPYCRTAGFRIDRQGAQRQVGSRYPGVDGSRFMLIHLRRPALDAGLGFPSKRPSPGRSAKG